MIKNKPSLIWVSLLIFILFSMLIIYTITGMHQDFMDSNSLSAITDSLGIPTWQYKSSQEIRATPALGTEYVYVRLEDGLLALNKKTGQLEWSVNSRAVNTLAPVEASRKVFISEWPNLVSAYSINGDFLWSQGPLSVPGSNLGKEHAEVSDIVTGDDIVYVARANWDITAYQMTTGEILWNFIIPSRIQPHIYHDSINKVVMFPANKTLYALDENTGKVAWSYEFDRNVYQMTGHNSLLFLEKPVTGSSEKITLLAFDISSKKVMWESIPLETSRILCLMTYENNLYSSGEGLAALSIEDGEVLFDMPSDDVTVTYSCPAIYAEKIFTIVETPYLFKYYKSLRTYSNFGKTIDQTELVYPHYGQSRNLRDNFPISPASDNDILVIPYNDYSVYTFHQ